MNINCKIIELSIHYDANVLSEKLMLFNKCFIKVFIFIYNFYALNNHILPVQILFSSDQSHDVPVVVVVVVVAVVAAAVVAVVVAVAAAAAALP